MTLGSTARWGAASSLPSGNPVATSTNAAAPTSFVIPFIFFYCPQLAGTPSDLDTKYIEAFNSMLAISPDSAEILRELYKNDDQWARILAKFRDAAAGARQGDTNGLKHKLKYLPSDSTMPIVPAIQDSKSKSDRGINHPMLRDAIIPWSLRLVINAPAPTGTETEEDAEEPEAVRALNALLFTGKLLNGKPALAAGRFPSCFYADGQYDPLVPEVGLLRSLFLLRVLRHIWTTPSSAMDGATKLKQRTRAWPVDHYAANDRVWARTMLSTSEWKRKDGKYNYERLLDAVVELFKNPAGAWTIETLAWYQKGVFGACGTTGADDSDSEDEDSEISVIAARSSASSDS
ncbi:hypothetical protein DFH07DRAFT_949329 [Mycena maculata]|uniref:Uncharacterized protein n=1 Tax=Mycena maculata TaxID=230809 RepID=A0AAD7NZT8_9AGAR|nr:hypothetical protein DFH07DRAFT_949329 [Mycena maculata]